MPAWEHSWIENIPIVGRTLWLFGWVASRYRTPYEEVADMLAEDLEKGGDRWIGKKVCFLQKDKIKDV